jgi:uncharacterized protein (DUF1501 family)
MMHNEDDLNELAILMKVLDILKLRIQKRELHNYEAIQISQITNQFLPGTVIGNFIQGRRVDLQGDMVMGDKYEAHGHAQVGAMGQGAKVKTVTFNSSQGEKTEVDLAILLKELQSLRAEMRSQALTTDDDLAVVAVGQAISSAEEGDSSKMFEHLKSAGKWAMGLATSIGAGVAAGAIKLTLGL